MTLSELPSEDASELEVALFLARWHTARCNVSLAARYLHIAEQLTPKAPDLFNAEAERQPKGGA